MTSSIREILDFCYKSGKFITKSGEIVDNWFDKHLMLSNPFMLEVVSRKMGELIPCGIDVLVPIPIGAIPIATKLSLDKNIPMAIVNRNVKSFGLAREIDGCSVNGMRTLIIEDVTYTGDAILKTAEILKRNNANIIGSLSILNRNKPEKFLIEGIVCEGMAFERNGELHINSRLIK